MQIPAFAYCRALLISAGIALLGTMGHAQSSKDDKNQSVNTTEMLKGVEKLYNNTRTLQANFTETYKSAGRTHSPEKGMLYLSKPGKTRWVYTVPEGSFFLSDGKYGYDYNKAKNSVDRFPMKQTDDMRIPLAFLLGNLDFQKDFGEFRAHREGSDVSVTAIPKNTSLLFTEIAMLIAPDSTIKQVSVTGQDNSVTQFVLENEQRNLKLADSLFKFTAPANATVVDLK
ncbi:MAG: outer membrane lipoprotein carrier protein LolA [Acidobacteriota bacterium]